MVPEDVIIMGFFLPCLLTETNILFSPTISKVTVSFLTKFKPCKQVLTTTGRVCKPICHMIQPVCQRHVVPESCVQAFFLVIKEVS